MAFWAQGCAVAELPQEEKATPSARLSGPFRTWKLLSPPEAELGFGSASRFMSSADKVAEGGRCMLFF